MTDPRMIELGQRVKALRHARDWKQVDLAKKAGLSQRVISNLERIGSTDRDSATLTTIFAVADAFGMPPSELLP